MCFGVWLKIVDKLLDDENNFRICKIKNIWNYEIKTLLMIKKFFCFFYLFDLLFFNIK